MAPSKAVTVTFALIGVVGICIMSSSMIAFYGLRSDSITKVSQSEEVEFRVKRQDPGIGDESQDPYEILASILPTKPGSDAINDRYMPTISSGLIGASVYSDSIHVNGLYNGKGGNSHRAKVPALIMARVRLAGNVNFVNRKFSFNALTGVFTETIDCDFALIKHRTYIHNKYIRLLVTEFSATRKPDFIGGGIFYIDYFQLNSTSDIKFDAPLPFRSNWEVKGTTLEAEDGANVQNVYVFYMDRIESISLRSTSSINETMIMAVDKVESNARADFEDALLQLSMPNGFEILHRMHVDSIMNISRMGRVEVQGDIVVTKLVNFAQYYLMSNFAPLYPFQNMQFSEPIFGVGRTSLARGDLGKDYQGHVFWDSEMYTLPYAILFNPEMAKRTFRYRTLMLNQAKQYALRSGVVGARYGWETAFSGGDVTPDRCVACRNKEIHVTAAVSFFIRQYYSATRDRDFLFNPIYMACDVSREIARYYATMAKYNTTKGRYELNDVVGPDEFQQGVNNNAYTNVAASLAIHWARFMACECGRTEREEVPDDWVQRALYLYLPFDTTQRVHYAFEGFEKSKNVTKIKQADVNLLGYPLNWNYSVDIQRNDLYYYESKFDSKTPAMTYSFNTIGWREINEPAKTLQYFRKSYQDYVIQPFKIWTEFNEQSASDQQAGSVNFLPGMGGFMQSIVNGFGGVRIRPLQLEFHRPAPPPGCQKMWLRGMKYLGTNMTVYIDAAKVIVTVHTIVPTVPLVLRRNDSSPEEELSVGDHTITNPAAGFFIYTNLGRTNCDPPRDYIYMYWGYSPWVSGTRLLKPSSYWLTLATAVLIGFISLPALAKGHLAF